MKPLPTTAMTLSGTRGSNRMTMMMKPVLMAGLAALLAGCASLSKPPQTFDLDAPQTAGNAPASRTQVLVPEPTTTGTLDRQQIVVMPTPLTIEYLGASQWSDRLPRLVQLRLVQALQNSGRFGAVGLPGQGLAIDYQAVSEIRRFDISYTTGQPVATIEIAVKALDDRSGVVRATRVFRVSEPLAGGDNPSLVAGLNGAFERIAAEIAGWFARVT